MFRKLTLGLIAAASLTLAAAAPASAGGFYHGHHWGHGYGYGWGPGCRRRHRRPLCRQRLERLPAAAHGRTRRGMRLRTVNVCAY